jgi:hypothetical protein
MSCPNINSPEWKALVKKNGKKKAMQIFVANNNQVPITTNKPKSGFDLISGFFVSQATTLEQMNKHPEITSKMIEELIKTHPDIVINKDGIIKEDGTFVPLKAGEKGMAVRNALHSMVAWANDAYLETPPHEYAHIYIDMYRNVPWVAKAIENYGEEKLAKKIGKYYAGEYTASGFKKLITKFWNMLRTIFGQPNIKYELFKAFKENRKLSTDVSRGNDVVNYQKVKTPYQRNDTAYVQEENLKKEVEKSSKSFYSFKKDTQGLNKKVALNKLAGEIILSKYWKSNSDKIGLDALIPGQLSFIFADLNSQATSETITKIRELYGDIIEDLMKEDIENGLYRNVEGFDETDLGKIKDSWSTANANSNAVLLWSLYTLFQLSDESVGNTSMLAQFQWDKFGIEEGSKEASSVIRRGTELAKKMYDVRKRMERARYQKKRLILTGDRSITIDKAKKLIKEEIEEASKKRLKYWYNKGWVQKAPFIKKMINWLNSQINKYQINARLQAKFLSGKDDSIIQQMLYEEFEVARHKKLIIKGKALEFYNKIIKDSKNLDGSQWKNKNKDISELKTYSVTLGKNKVDLTESEILNLYLMSRMKVTQDQMLADGIVLRDVVKGRKAKGKLNPTLTDLDAITQIVESDTRLKGVIEAFDNAMKVLYEDFNKAHMDEFGVELANISDYFPATYGERDHTKQRTEKKKVAHISQRFRKRGDKAPVAIRDAYKAMGDYIEYVGHYAGYNLPINNARKVLKQLKLEYSKDTTNPDFDLINNLLQALEGNINNIEDSSLLFSSQGAEKGMKFFKKIMNNFSVAVLSLNVPVMAKQPISYMAAAEVIDSKYLKEAGWGVGMVAGINYKEVFDQLKKKKITEGDNIFPAEWRLDENSNPLIKIIKEFSPIIKERFEGSIDRETGETMMDSRINDDSVRIPFSRYLKKWFKGDKNAKDYQFSKNAMMAGVKAFDTATVVSIWKAVQLETKDVLGLTEADGDAFYEHVSRRTEEILNKTQPTFDLNNRTGAASLTGAIPRMLTMFGSARSKLGMLMIEGIVDYMNNPNDKTSRNKMFKRFVNVGILNAMAIAVVDIISRGLLGSGFDDEDDILPFAGWKMASTVAGSFYGLGTAFDTVASNLDEEPWRRDIQTPVSAVAQEFTSVISNTFKGNFGKATEKLIQSYSKAKGIPLYPWMVSKNITKRYIID